MVTLEKVDSRALVVQRLKEYGEKVKRIEFLQQKTRGIGLGIEINTSSSLSSEQDVLGALQQKLKGMPVHMYLSESEQQLLTAWNAYMFDKKRGVSLSSNLRNLRSLKEYDETAQTNTFAGFTEDEMDESLLRTLERKLQEVVNARQEDHGRKDPMDVAVQRVEARQKAQRELEQLKEEVSELEYALQCLGRYKPLHLKLLRLRYVHHKSVVASLELLDNISRRTYERYHLDAVDALGYLLFGQE